MLLVTYYQWIFGGIAFVLFPLALLYLWIRNRSYSYSLRQSYSVETYLRSELRKKEDGLKIKDDELDSIFASLFQWVILTGDYRKTLIELSSAIESRTLKDAITNLETQYSNLIEMFESDRKKHMEKIRNSGDYSEQVEMVVHRIGEALIGMQTGKRAEEAPILNNNREN
jgi:hypothetical protein